MNITNILRSPKALAQSAGLVMTLACAGCSAPQPASESPVEAAVDATSTVRHYVCNGGVTLSVAYVNLNDGRSFATLSYDKSLHTMHQAVAASGELYVAFDPNSQLAWHTKGDEGVLLERSDDAHAQDTFLADDCVAR